MHSGATLETRGKLHGAEICSAVVSGIVTGDAPVTVSYWPILSLVPSNSPRGLCKSYSTQFPPMRVQLCNFLSSFILILGDRFSPFRAFFYILPLLGVTFALPILQSPRLTGGRSYPKGKLMRLCV